MCIRDRVLAPKGWPLSWLTRGFGCVGPLVVAPMLSLDGLDDELNPGGAIAAGKPDPTLSPPPAHAESRPARAKAKAKAAAAKMCCFAPKYCDKKAVGKEKHCREHQREADAATADAKRQGGEAWACFHKL
eukprot:9669496-Alexandrium_andersonii.AAC.1